MPIVAEFEEKEFECSFNSELRVINRTNWSPGQQLEHYIGFDAAAMVDYHDFPLWFMRRYQRRMFDLRRGVRLRAGYYERAFGIFDHKLPPFSFNFFAQYKRPEYVYGHNGGQFQCWKEPYFRFEIDDHQNRILSKLRSICGASAVITYCCPAYYKKNDLWNAKIGGNVIRLTNYADPARLKGHHLYSFKEAGARGKGHSEEEDIIGESIEEQFARARVANEPRPLSEVVMDAGKSVRSLIIDEGDLSLPRTVVENLTGLRFIEAEIRSPAIATAHLIALNVTYGTSIICVSPYRYW